MTDKKTGAGAWRAPSPANIERTGLAAPSQYSVKSTVSHRVGDTIRQYARGVTHVYLLARVEPHISARGKQSALLAWQGCCVLCGDRFEHITGRRAPRYLNRTCRPCRDHVGGA
jgi:hypothetical protein